MGTVIEFTAASAAPPPKPKRPGARKRQRTAFPAAWTPDVPERRIADEVGMSKDCRRIQWNQFSAFHQSRGSLMASWPQAWRTWCYKWEERNAPSSQQRPNGGGFAGIARRLGEEE